MDMVVLRMLHPVDKRLVDTSDLVKALEALLLRT